MLSERGVLLRPEANELRTGFADHTQNEAGTEQVQPRDQEASIRRTDNFRQECHNAKTHREKTKMTSEHEKYNGAKGKSIGQKEVEQMKGTREMSNEERKQSKKKQKKEERQDDTHRNIT